MDRISVAYINLLKYFGFAFVLGLWAIFNVPPYYPNFNFAMGIIIGLSLCGKPFVRDWKAFHNATQLVITELYNEYQRLKQKQ